MGAVQQLDLNIAAKNNTDAAFNALKTTLQQTAAQTEAATKQMATGWDVMTQKQRQAYLSAQEQAIKFNQSLGTTNDKAQLLAGNINLLSNTTTSLGQSLGVPTQALGVLNTTGDVTALVMGKMTTATVGFNAATIGMVGAAGAAGAALGSFLRYLGEGDGMLGLNTRELDANVAKLMGYTAQLKDTEKAQADFVKSIAEINAKAREMRAATQLALPGEQGAEQAAMAARQKAEDDAAKKAIETAQKVTAEKKRLSDEAAKWEVANLERIATEQKGVTAAVLKMKEEELSQAQRVAKAIADDYIASVEERKKAEETWARLKEELLQREIAGMRTLADAFANLGQVVGGVFGGMLQIGGGVLNFMADLDAETYKNMSTWEKWATAINGFGNAYQSGSFGGGAMSGIGAGAALGSMIPGVGTIIGGIGGGLIGGVLGLFGGDSKDKKQAEELKKQFIEAAGGLDVLKAKAAEAGISLDKLFDAKKAKEMEKAIGDIKKGLESWEEAENKTLAAMEKYGITIDQMGESFAQLQLDKQFGELYESYNLLTQAGADVSVVNEKMAADINAYIQNSIKAGTEIPMAMKPILESLIQQGLLFDAAGNQITDIGQLDFAETVTQQVQAIVDAVEQLVDALKAALGLGGELGGMFGNITGGTSGGTAPYGGKGSIPGLPKTATGGWFQQIPGGHARIIAEEGNEAVLNEPQLQQLVRMAVVQAAAEMGGSYRPGGDRGGEAIHTTVMLDGRPIAKSVGKATRRGQVRINPRAFRAGRT